MQLGAARGVSWRP